MSLALDFTVAGDLAVAALAGLAVGIEREWSGHASGPAARFAGARTFLLLGLLGGTAGWLAGGGLTALAAVLLAAAAALSTPAYVMAARRNPGDVEGTTEVAALVVLALGAAAGLGFPPLTSAAAAVMVLALVEKSRIQSMVKRIGEREMAAALQFAVLALVVLPLLPTGPYGPYGAIRPRALWTVVLLFSGISFAGYLARRAVGPTRGYGLTGLLGGVVSSTAVTLGFAHQSRQDRGLGPALASGVAGASTVVLVRVLVISVLLNPALAWASVPYLAPALAVGAGFVAFALTRRPSHPADEPALADGRSPLGLWSAIKMALGLQIVLLAMPFVWDVWGTRGVLGSAVVVGITDMDALTLSMARLGDTPAVVALAAQAIAVGALASMLFKLVLSLVLGSSVFRRRVAIGLTALAAASAFGLWIAG